MSDPDPHIEIIATLQDRIYTLEETVEANKERAGFATDEPHVTMVRSEAAILTSALQREYEAAFERGRQATATAQGVLTQEIRDVAQQSKELSMAAAAAAGKAAQDIEDKLSNQIGTNKAMVSRLQTTVEEVQGNVTVVLTALVTMQRTNMKMLGAATLIGGVLIFILSRALGF